MTILGRPNVGKSTLLNALIKQKIAIVSDKPQTTRSRVLGVGHYPQAQLVLIDTPGVHKPRHQLNTQMLRTALGSLQEADVVYVMVDARKSPGAGDWFVVEQVKEASQARPYRGVFLLLNKVDVVKKLQLLPIIERYNECGLWTEIIPISAQTGVNLDRLINVTLDCLPDEDIQYYDEDFVTDQPMRQLAAELIREKVLMQTRDELPYAVAVMIEGFREDGPRAHITATILVEKPSQKGILIGKGGQRLKIIGSLARTEMEQLFGLRIFLELWVKVQDGWRDDEHLLVELGYG